MTMQELGNVKIGDRVIITQTGRDRGLECVIIGFEDPDDYVYIHYTYDDDTSHEVMSRRPKIVLEPADPNRVFYSGPHKFTRRMVTINYGHLKLIKEEL